MGRPCIHGGYNDVGGHIKWEKCYIMWRSMFHRCYDPKFHERNPTYKGCTVCEEWFYYSNFKKWFYERYVRNSNQSLDKDILVKGNKVYSPETCCLVPPRINYLILTTRGKRGQYPIGVHFKDGFFVAQLNENGTIIDLGRHSTPEDAFQAYKRAKEAYIAYQAQLSFVKGQIDERTLNALLNYKIEITD
jgi:hypothetical protein